jgi:hypothetical protein
VADRWFFCLPFLTTFTALASSHIPSINARFIEQTDGQYLVKTIGAAEMHFASDDFKSALEHLVYLVNQLKKAHMLPEDFNIATQVKIDVASQ